MGEFLDKFKPDSDFEDSRWVWKTDKPVLREAVVRFAPYDPTFHRAKAGRVYLLDPSCPSALIPNDQVAVVIYERESDLASQQENAWEYLMANAEGVEQNLLKKLHSIQIKCLAQHEEELPGNRPFQNHWTNILAEIPDPATSIEKFYKLAGISLAPSGMDDCAFVGFEFQTAWDQDHGLEILMHRDRVLAAAGMTELMVPGKSILEEVRAIQEYDLDPDDFVV